MFFFVGENSILSFQLDQCGPPSASLGRGVAEVEDKGMAGEQTANPVPLHPFSPSVDKSYFGKAFALGGFQVGLYDVWNVFGREGMQVDKGFDRQDDRIEIIRI